MGIREIKIAKETFRFMQENVRLDTLLGKKLVAAKNNTEHFKEEQNILLQTRSPNELLFSVVEVTNENCLVACERLHKEAYNEPCVLNFADALVAGGLFFEGATTQEEAICRSTGLYYCIDGHELYQRNQKVGAYRGLALHDILYSPGVPLFRDPQTETLRKPEELYDVSVITSAAPEMYSAARFYSKEEIEAKIVERISRILTILSNKKVEAVVLGAWGCGAFGNDPNVVAKIFNEQLTTAFHGHFKKVVFAIFENEGDYNIKTFREIIQTTS